MELKKAPFLVIFFLVFSLTSNAQEELFKVLASKGENKVSSGNGGWTNMTIGKKLAKTDKILVAANGYLGLAHSCGKTIEIKKPGTYEVGKLSSEVAAQNQGVCKKYVDFVVGEMTSQDEDVTKNRYKYMATTGSVERGDGVETFIPKEAEVLQKTITLHWILDTAKRGDRAYVVKVFDLYNESKFELKTNETQVDIDLSKIEIPEDNMLLWTVEYERGNLNEPVIRTLKIATEKSKEEIKELETAKIELGGESALTNLVMASIYAEKNLLVDAIHCFEKAITLQPDVESYRIAYMDFLMEKGLVSEKKDQKPDPSKKDKGSK